MGLTQEFDTANRNKPFCTLGWIFSAECLQIRDIFTDCLTVMIIKRASKVNDCLQILDIVIPDIVICPLIVITFPASFIVKFLLIMLCYSDIPFYSDKILCFLEYLYNKILLTCQTTTMMTWQSMEPSIQWTPTLQEQSAKQEVYNSTW